MTSKLDGYYTIDDLCDAAIQAAQLSGDNDLGRALNFKSNRVTSWRTRRAHPSDEAVVKVAILAGVDPRQALMNLQIWRNENDPEVVKCYEAIREVIRKTAAVFVIAILAMAMYSPNPAFANSSREQITHKSLFGLVNLYIMRQSL